MYLKTIYSTLLSVLFIAGSLVAQDHTLSLQNDSEIRLDGDSNVRTWGADAEQISGTLILQNLETVTLENITADTFKELTLTIAVDGLDSGTRGLTRNMHNYLKSDDHPNITFTLNRITNIDMQGSTVVISAEGVVNAAGQDHTVNMQVNASVNSNGSLNFTGEQPLLMTDFGIEPPRALMGTVRADDEILITYNVNFSR